jgi:phage baseplate assembly protein W
MAVILGSKQVKDLKQYNDTAIGITLPLQITNTAFNQSFTTFEQVKTNIISLLLTRRKERVMQPLLGSGLNELVFDLNDSRLSSDIEDTIITVMEQWLPFVSVENIDIIQTNELKDLNRIDVSISFRVGNSVELNEVTFTL